MFDHHQKIRHEIKSTDDSKISKKLISIDLVTTSWALIG